MLFDIRSRRLAAKPKITVAEISARSGVSLAGIRFIEQDRVPNPGVLTLKAIEDALVLLESERKAAAFAAETQPH